MFDLERTERRLILFLVATLILGAGVSAYSKLRPVPPVEVGHFAPGMASAGARLGPEGGKARININTATVEELTELKGVGTVIAGRIVAYRNSRGLFVMAEDIKKVEGIGPALYEKISSEITVD